MAGERRLYLERNCRLPESPAHSRRRNREGPASSKGLNSQRGFGPAVEPRRKSRPRSTSLHGSSPCKCQRLSTLRWDRLPPSRPSTKSGARAGGRRLSDRRLHCWLAGTRRIRTLFPRRGRPAGAESCTHLCEEPTRKDQLLFDQGSCLAEPLWMRHKAKHGNEKQIRTPCCGAPRGRPQLSRAHRVPRTPFTHLNEEQFR